MTDLSGDRTRSKRWTPAPPSILQRVEEIVRGQWSSTEPPTKTQEDGYRYASEAFTKTLADLRQLLDVDLKRVEDRLEALGAPWTPSRLPEWK